MNRIPLVWAIAAVGPFALAGCGKDADPRITAPTAPAAFAVVASNFSVWSNPVDLGPDINTSFNEQQPALSRDALVLYFMSNRPEHVDDAVLDNNIWIARRACIGCSWETPVRLGAPINGPGNDAAPTLSRDEHWLFFASNRPGSQANDVWASYREHVHDDFGWGPPVNLGPGINSAANETAPAYFEGDGGAPQLYFNRQTGAPGLPTGDIYVSALGSDGTWGAAVPVDELNGPAADQRASIRFDGREIYFWSGRDAGRGEPGDAYLWHATRGSVDDAWSEPRLVPDPINAVSTIHPHIHSRGNVETLVFSRNPAAPALNLELFMSTRERVGAP